MRLFVFTLITLLGCVCVHAAEKGFHQYELTGFTNTPFLPGGEFRVHQSDRPLPVRVIPSKAPAIIGSSAPSDAVILFDGKNLDQFLPSPWLVTDGSVIAGKGNLVTKNAYGDCQFHVSWRAPGPPQGSPSNMGNSGILFMGLYELQVYDSYSSKIYADGSAAAIYGQIPPLVNACRKPGEWQTYDVIFMAPKFDKDGKLLEAARITVLHNGVLVQNNAKIIGPMAYKNFFPYKAHAAKLPITIQGHVSPVEFRDIWMRELDSEL